MFVALVTVVLAIATMFVKWFITVSEARKRGQLTEVVEAHNTVRQRLKLAVGAVSIVDAEISKLQRSIRGRQRKIPTLSQEYKKLETDAQSQAALARQKAELTEELNKKR
jgi:cell shape-determining protein MreC